MTTTQTMRPETILKRWNVLSNPQKATLAQAEKEGKEVEATIAEYPFGNYLVGLEIKGGSR